MSWIGRRIWILLKYVSASVFFVPGQTDFFMEKINVTNKEFIDIFKK
jgi:hypothetical protein